MDNIYTSLIEAIVAKQTSILGPTLAVAKARRVSGLEVDDNGRVAAIIGNPLKILEGLVKEYQSLSGVLAIQFCKSAISPLVSNYPNLELPAILK